MANVSIIIGRKNSKGLPGKNLLDVQGRPLASYVFEAAANTKGLDEHFLSTDCPNLKNIARQYGIETIERPKHLCSDAALGEDVYESVYQHLRESGVVNENSLFALLMCNAPFVTAEKIQTGIELLKENTVIDSAVTVSKYNMWSPLRARKLDDNDLLIPFVPFESFGDPSSLSCDRDSQGDVYYADMGVSVVRARCLRDMNEGLLPQRWMGQKIAPIFQEGGFDLDYSWQIPAVEDWIKRNCN